ncbi:hypothetical protein [Haemophilus paraphrohaemolyticus]|uniref:hypothetical protein n=1 Tax=Haemophilus paraphrohaemolyticus TaxID=736 RepID=UPI00352BD885
MNNNNEPYRCPACGGVLKDWREFSEKSEIDKIKPFECTGFHCGMRWNEEEMSNGKST